MKNITATMRRRTNNPLAPIFKLEIPMPENRQNINKNTLISPIISPIISHNFSPDTEQQIQKTKNLQSGLFPEIKTHCILPHELKINIMDEIIPNLWLGEIVNETDLLHYKFTHVLSVIDKKPDFLESPNFITKWINIKDNGSENISRHFEECSDFIHNSLLSGGKIYVHCQMGFSRSPTIVIAYIMKYGFCPTKKHNVPFYDAIGYVGSKRPSICPNFGFNIYLQNYEKNLQEKSI